MNLPEALTDVMPDLPGGLAPRFARFYAQTWEPALLPPRLLELCRLRIAQLHDSAPDLALRVPEAAITGDEVSQLSDWQHSAEFSPAERAALTIAELIPWQHHDIADEQVAAARELLGSDAALIALLTALALFDASSRLRVLFSTSPA